MLGWSFETSLALRKTRKRSSNLSPVSLDASPFYVGLLFVNSQRPDTSLCFARSITPQSLDYGLGSRGPRGQRVWRFTPELYALPAATTYEQGAPPQTQLLPRRFRT